LRRAGLGRVKGGRCREGGKGGEAVIVTLLKRVGLYNTSTSCMAKESCRAETRWLCDYD